MSTPTDTLGAALVAIPTTYRKPLLKAYRDLKSRHLEGKFDAAGLSAGKFCEAVLRVLQNHLSQTVVPFGTKNLKFDQECRKLANVPTTTLVGDESLRLVIPKALDFAYTLRNKRGIGHVGGDVDANAVDSGSIVTCCDWVVCELIRILHQLSLEEAQDLVDSVSTRKLPEIWEVGGKKRVLRNDLDFKDKVLLLLYDSHNRSVMEEDLFDWTKYSGLGMFRKAVLAPLDKDCLIEYDRDTKSVTISPLGIKRVEEEIRQPD